MIANKNLDISFIEEYYCGKMLLEDACNEVESYIYHINNNLVDDDEAVDIAPNEKKCVEVLNTTKEVVD